MKQLNNMKVGTLGGTLCSIWASFNFGELLHTVIMAAVGTVVSFTVSKFLQRNKKHKR